MKERVKIYFYLFWKNIEYIVEGKTLEKFFGDIVIRFYVMVFLDECCVFVR